MCPCGPAQPRASPSKGPSERPCPPAAPSPSGLVENRLILSYFLVFLLSLPLSIKLFEPEEFLLQPRRPLPCPPGCPGCGKRGILLRWCRQTCSTTIKPGLWSLLHQMGASQHGQTHGDEGRQHRHPLCVPTLGTSVGFFTQHL